MPETRDNVCVSSQTPRKHTGPAALPPLTRSERHTQWDQSSFMWRVVLSTCCAQYNCKKLAEVNTTLFSMKEMDALESKAACPVWRSWNGEDVRTITKLQ